MKEKKFITLLLVSIMMLSASSCGKRGTETEVGHNNIVEVEETVEAETDVYETLPTGNYDGYNFTALQFVFQHLENMTKYHMTVDEMTGEAVSDALYTTSRDVEERLDIVLKTDVRKDSAEVQELIEAQVLADDDTYDAFLAHGTNASEKGYSLKLNDIDAFDFSQSWWKKSAMDCLSITGDIYRAYGDLSLQGYGNYKVLLFNKSIQQNYQIEDLYDVVRNGRWTLDKMDEVASRTSIDLNGDNVMKPTDDLYGMAMAMVNVHACLTAGDTSLIGFDDSHNAYYKGPDEHYIDVFTRLADMISNKNKFYEAWVSPGLSQYHMFSEDRALLCGLQLIEMEQLRDMESDYGVLPYPKYNEEQEKYISDIYNDYTPLEIPKTSDNPERTGVILENLCAETYRCVKDIYIEDMLQTKLVRDKESIEMMNLIFDSETRMDILILYGWNNIWNSLNNVLRSNGETLISTLTEIEQGVIASVQASVENLR